jgi:hypothetical protein
MSKPPVVCTLASMVLLVLGQLLVATSCSTSAPNSPTVAPSASTQTPSPSTDNPRPATATPDVLCIELTKDGSQEFVSHGPCNNSNGGPGEGTHGGGAPNPQAEQCLTQRRTALLACNQQKSAEAKTMCYKKAQGQFAGCLVESVVQAPDLQ